MSASSGPAPNRVRPCIWHDEAQLTPWEFGARSLVRSTVFRGAALGFGFVQGHGGANESLQRLLVYLLALAEVDGAPRVPIKTGVEEARRILQRRPFGEGHLHHVLVGLARADQSVVRPHRNPSPLPLLDDFGIGLLDQGTQPAEHLRSAEHTSALPSPDHLVCRLLLEKKTW